MLLKLLQRAKISLAFHLLVEPSANRPRSAEFVTSRWFESLASGCIVVGKRPKGDMANELFAWPNALIELPDHAGEAASLIHRLTQNVELLKTSRLLNVVEMCERHDWRYRIRDIYEHFQLPLPDMLKQEIALLKSRVQSLRSGKT